MLVYALVTIVLGLTTAAFVVALPLLALAGGADVSSAILRNTIIQTATPDDLRGRVTSFHVLSSAGGPRVGDIRAAFMAELFGAGRGARRSGGVIAVAGVGVVTRWFPELRAYRIARPEAAPSGAEVAASDDEVATPTTHLIPGQSRGLNGRRELPRQR